MNHARDVPHAGEGRASCRRKTCHKQRRMCHIQGMWRKHQLLEDLLASFHWKA